MIDLKNQRFGKLLVKKYHHSGDGAFWLCLCDCGQESIVKGTHLRYGSTKSCGCGSIAQAIANCKTHCLDVKLPFPFRRQLQELRHNMVSRCYDPRNKRWANYGGRGIRVCRVWRTNLRAFYDWANRNGFIKGLQIDRIDVDGNYEPRNCRFVDRYVQQNNTTRNHCLTWNGKTQTIAQWARTIGIPPQALRHRIARNWSIDRALTQPLYAPS